jgi:hypothetical protein
MGEAYRLPWAPSSSHVAEQPHLTVDTDVLKAALKAALDHDTSVNHMVRDYLAELARDTGERRSARVDSRRSA